MQKKISLFRGLIRGTTFLHLRNEVGQRSFLQVPLQRVAGRRKYSANSGLNTMTHRTGLVGLLRGQNKRFGVLYGPENLG